MVAKGVLNIFTGEGLIGSVSRRQVAWVFAESSEPQPSAASALQTAWCLPHQAWGPSNGRLGQLNKALALVTETSENDAKKEKISVSNPLKPAFQWFQFACLSLRHECHSLLPFPEWTHVHLLLCKPRRLLPAQKSCFLCVDSWANLCDVILTSKLGNRSMGMCAT